MNTRQDLPASIYAGKIPPTNLSSRTSAPSNRVLPKAYSSSRDRPSTLSISIGKERANACSYRGPRLRGGSVSICYQAS